MTVTSTLEERDLLRASVHDALEQLSASADVRRAMATARGFDEPTWRRLAHELGLPGLTLPAEFGGAGLTEEELAIAFEEAGARLLCAPLFATAGLAIPLLQAIGDDAAIARYAASIASGDLTATVALAEDTGRWRTDAVRCVAAKDGGGWVIDGVKNYVVDGATAGLILVIAQAGGELGVFAVAGDAPGLKREQLVTLDQTRKQARLVFTYTPAERVGADDATTPIGRATAVSRALLAAEQVGGAQRCLDMTVAYAKSRTQFGRPIGSFQAVKQRLAECLVLVESARSAALTAVTAAVAGDDEMEHVAAVAALTCGDAYTWVSEQTIQLHGGIGFTWEHDAHLYFKRARTSALLLGTAGELVELIGGQLETAIS
jgi:alkylation response protein AidB-like acyl-CoA dehydrogenase